MSTRFLTALSVRLLSRQWATENPLICKTPSSGTGLCAYPCRSSWGSRKHVPPVCWSPTPFSFASSVNSLRLQSDPSCRLLVKLLNNIRASVDLWYIPLITGLWLDLVTLIRTLQAQPLAIFHLISLSDYRPHTQTVCLWGSYRRQCQRRY